MWILFHLYDNSVEKRKISKLPIVFSRNSSTDTQQGNCYTQLTSNQDCVEPLGMKLSKKDCCCGKNMGKGWGNTCEHCPSQGMGKYC